MQKKINLLLVFLVVFGILFTGLLQNNMSKTSYIEDVQERLISTVKLIREGAMSYERVTDESGLSYLERAAQSGGVRLTLIHDDGLVAFDSQEDWSQMENHRDRPEIKLAAEGKIGISQRYSSTVKMDMYYVAVKYEHDEEDYVLRVALPLSKIAEANRRTLIDIVLVAIVGILLSLGIGGRVSQKITRPIKDLTAITKRVADGHYDERIYIKSGDEMGELAHNFNVMSDEVNKKIMEINESSIQTNAILSSMINGVIAVDNSKKVMFVNSSAEHMFNFKESDIVGKHILKVLRNSKLDDQIHNMITNNIMMRIEIEVDEPEKRIFNLYSNPIVSSVVGNEKIGVVIIIQDVTEMKKLENMRKDFVANVSHELKTPLTSIKGFVETLLDGASEQSDVREKFLGIIDVEVERLNSLIEDLLILSEIEKNETVANHEDIHLPRATRHIMDMLNEVAKSRGITLLFNCEENLPTLLGNEGWLKQMIVNLVDNAIKYSNENGQVRVSISHEEDAIKLSVKDNGVGISEDQLERLFERFYRVDKARSRSIGGTGLGLAIVKHVVISFNGKIDVLSEYGVGTEFIVTLPLAK